RLQGTRASEPAPGERRRHLSPIGRHLEPLGQSFTGRQPGSAAFALGVPDLEFFPHDIWNRIINRCQRRLSAGRDPRIRINGIQTLREAVASYLVSARGLHCTPEQVDIVPGSVAGIMVTALTLLGADDQAWMEEPGYSNALGVIRYRGAATVPVPVDDEGLNVAAGLALAPTARLAYVTPSHQHPLGVTMSLARRQQLLAWAEQQDAWIIEDDYDSEFRYDGPPITALQGLDRAQRVVYCGTFSKVMFPELRLGYVVLPPELMAAYTGVKMPLSLYSPMLMQAAVAEFMLTGHFVRHVRRMRDEYRARRDALAAALQQHLAGAVTVGEARGGMHLVAYLAPELDEAMVLKAAREVGMALMPLSSFYHGSEARAGLILGFTNVRPEAIEGYIVRLAARLG
ncbi:MAG: PLP-dependent aminotransferase family protein, partial [Anaerolineales bacterium]|nr:PLP-dependent aminotransferase family protein [Anaerolineales bacterium]